MKYEINHKTRGKKNREGWGEGRETDRQTDIQADRQTETDSAFT